MKVEETFISGLKIIYLNRFTDLRGDFVKVFNQNYFIENGLETDFRESYYSISAKNVIRGMHFQTPPEAHTKIVYLNSGKILDVVLDIRSESPTFGRYFSIELTTDNPLLLYIPKGCAHGFLSREENSMITYLQTTCYNSVNDTGIRYDSFGMNWNNETSILSERDLAFPTLNTFNSPF